MKGRLLLASCGIAALTLLGSAAVAAAPGTYVCSGGTPGSPTVIPATGYGSVTVTGNCVFGPGTMTINGNLTVAAGAALNDHASGQAIVHITGNASVGKGGVLGLGDYYPPDQSATVDGSIIANQPLTLYIGGATVHGNVVSNGGGVLSTSAEDFRNFPFKDNTVDGNVIIQGWHGGWVGLIRNSVGGNVIVNNNVSMSTEEGPGIDSDSTEVMGSVLGPQTIGGNLICHGNVPAAQVNGGDGGLPNTVLGRAIGQCAGLAG